MLVLRLSAFDLLGSGPEEVVSAYLWKHLPEGGTNFYLLPRETLGKLLKLQRLVVNLFLNPFLTFFWLEEQQLLKILLWSAKSALFKAAAELQAETQPLRASREHGECVGTLSKEKIYAAIKTRKPGVLKAIQTFCKQRSTYLTSYAPAEQELPQNQDFDYSNFMKMGLDDPFWNNGFLYLSRDPWAVDPV
ncbi:hypothetical protein VP01_3677g1 [Puccinia sorghi]|uniref:Uncharacterized protein n=1 Tax=Puccinia sorghi TaxID=27349 RepID=A0A0L6UUG8_9BASI|nr:hypothetical protein VP01_3677g1 [Puccinia sorghi]